jgi:hypothetical protein
MTPLTRRGMVRPKKVGVGGPARVVGLRSGPGYEFLRLL